MNIQYHILMEENNLMNDEINLLRQIGELEQIMYHTRTKSKSDWNDLLDRYLDLHESLRIVQEELDDFGVL